MTSSLVEILVNLHSDPTLAIKLYEELYNSTFFALVRSSTQYKVELMEFVTYPTKDGIKELPIFTSKELMLDFPDAQPYIVEVNGKLLWPRLLDIIEPKISEVAVDPGQSHGIRLNNSMIRGMISMYGTH
jgi:hypothetical protein